MNKKRIRFCRFFGILYITFFVGFMFYKQPFYSPYYCKIDCCIHMMRPLKYSVIMLIPLVTEVQQTFEKELSYAVVLRRGAWKRVFVQQMKQIVLSSSVYAVVFIMCIFLWNRGLSLLNWDVKESCFYDETHKLVLLNKLLVISATLVICITRNVILQSIVLLSLWCFCTFLPGILLICFISCFEIVQMKIGLFYWLFSSDYRIWISRMLRIMMILGACIYAAVLYILFMVAIKKKEL